MPVAIQVEDDRAHRFVLTRAQAAELLDALEQERSPAALSIARAIRERDEELPESLDDELAETDREQVLEYLEWLRRDPVQPDPPELEALYRAIERVSQQRPERKRSRWF